MKRIFIIIIFIIIGNDAINRCATARILNVPDDHETIQAAIDAVEGGDTILVQPGTYEENLMIETAGITIGSLLLTTGEAEHIESTIIDGGGNESVIQIWVRGREAVNLRGFTIRNGNPRGIDCQIGRIFIEDMLVTENGGNSWGGGIHAEAHESGGASVTIRRSRIDRNHAIAGGGISSLSGAIEIEDCSISNNIATGFEGWGGGGIYASTSMFVTAPIVTIRRTLIINNHSDVDYGAADFMWAAVEMDNVTVTGNTVGDDFDHGGLRFDSYEHGAPPSSITNSIIYGNEGYEIKTLYNDQVSIAYCDIEGGHDGVDESRQNQLRWGAGMISDDPQFVDPENGDYHLSEDSPCIDAGNPANRDPDGTRVEMGAFYFDQSDQLRLLRPLADVTFDEDCGRIDICALDTIFADAEGNVPGYSATGSDQLGLTIDEAGVLALDPVLNFFGDSLIVTIFAFENEDTVSLEFRVTVNSVNDVPTAFGLEYPADDTTLFHIDGRYILFTWTNSFDPDSGAALYYNLQGLFSIEEMNQQGHWDSYDTLIINGNVDDTFFIFDTWPFVRDFGVTGTDILWRVGAISQEDTIWCDAPFNFHFQIETSVEEDGWIPAKFALLSAYPNPFNSTVTITFSTGMNARPTRLGVYDVQGRLVADLLAEYPPFNSPPASRGGKQTVVWDAGSVGAGIYLVRLEEPQKTTVSKIILLR